MRNLPPHELYALKLQCLDLGYALFEPNPNGAYDHVRIGDVGYISEDGKFMKLFNAFSDRNSQPNAGSCFPDNFEPIQPMYRQQDRLEPVSPGCRRSQSVTMIGGGLSITGPVPGFISGGSLTLSCSNGAGAALITKYKGTRQKALASTAMEAYMMTHASSWLRLAQNLGRPVQMHDLVFVKGCVLTGDWANVSWNSTSCETSVGFSVGLPAMLSLEVSFWGQWRQHVDVPKRQGPDRDAPIPDGDLPIYDQCAFIKGIRIAEREWYSKLAYHLRVTSGNGRRNSERSILKALSDRDFKVKPVGDLGSNFHSVRNVYDALAIYMLEKSNAQLALIDDRDVYQLNMHEASTLNEICGTLLDLGTAGPTVEVTKSDSGKSIARLSWDKNECAPVPSSAEDLLNKLVLLDENMERLGISDEDLSQKESPNPDCPYIADSKTPTKITFSDGQSEQVPVLDGPPPLPPPLQFNTSFKTALLNYVARKKVKDFKADVKVDGPEHAQEWTTTYMIGGVKYGSSTQSRKKGSAEEAARQALTKLWRERPYEVEFTRPYLPILRNYLTTHGLTETVNLLYEENKSLQEWVCIIRGYNKEMARGTGRTKKVAAENAATDAVRNWDDIWGA